MCANASNTAHANDLKKHQKYHINLTLKFMSGNINHCKCYNTTVYYYKCRYITGIYNFAIDYIIIIFGVSKILI